MNTSPQILVDIDPPIAAVKEVAGRRLGVVLATGEATLVFPSCAIPATSREFDRRDWPEFPGKPAPRVLLKKGIYAVTSSHLLPTPGQVNIDALLFFSKRPISISAAHQDAVDLIAAAAGWLATFRSWIGLWTQSPQSNLVQQFHPYSKVGYDSDPDWANLYSSGEVRTIITGSLLANLDMIRAAADGATSKIEIAPEHVMLTRAVENSHTSQNRAAVMDACTSVEIALGRFVRYSLTEKGRKEKEVEEILRGASGVAEIFRYYLALSSSKISIGRMIDQLARPRNDAVHGGTRPDDNTTRKAISVAVDLLAETSPIQTTNQIRREARRIW